MSPRSIGPYQVTERVGLIAYRFKLLAKFVRIHDVFLCIHVGEIYFRSVTCVASATNLAERKFELLGRSNSDPQQEGASIEKQYDPTHEDSLKTPWSGEGNLGDRRLHEKEVLDTLHLRISKFRRRNFIRRR